MKRSTILRSFTWIARLVILVSALQAAPRAGLAATAVSARPAPSATVSDLDEWSRAGAPAYDLRRERRDPR